MENTVYLRYGLVEIQKTDEGKMEFLIADRVKTRYGLIKYENNKLEIQWYQVPSFLIILNPNHKTKLFFVRGFEQIWIKLNGDQFFELRTKEIRDVNLEPIIEETEELCEINLNSTEDLELGLKNLRRKIFLFNILKKFTKNGRVNVKVQNELNDTECVLQEFGEDEAVRSWNAYSKA